MSIALHIERLVVDEAVLAGERAGSVRAALEVELGRLLAQPGLPAETQGVLHLLRCGAQGQLVLHGVDRRGNGKRSWQELHLAAQLAPGRIEVGAPADFVVLDTGHPSLAGRRGDALIDGWIFAGQRSLVSAVWRRGRQVVREGRHVAREGIVRRYRAAVMALLDG